MKTKQIESLLKVEKSALIAKNFILADLARQKRLIILASFN